MKLFKILSKLGKFIMKKIRKIFKKHGVVDGTAKIVQMAAVAAGATTIAVKAVKAMKRRHDAKIVASSLDNPVKKLPTYASPMEMLREKYPDRFKSIHKMTKKEKEEERMKELYCREQAIEILSEGRNEFFRSLPYKEREDILISEHAPIDRIAEECRYNLEYQNKICENVNNINRKTFSDIEEESSELRFVRNMLPKSLGYEEKARERAAWTEMQRDLISRIAEHPSVKMPYHAYPIETAERFYFHAEDNTLRTATKYEDVHEFVPKIRAYAEKYLNNHMPVYPSPMIWDDPKIPYSKFKEVAKKTALHKKALLIKKTPWQRRVYLARRTPMPELYAKLEFLLKRWEYADKENPEGVWHNPVYHQLHTLKPYYAEMPDAKYQLKGRDDPEVFGAFMEKYWAEHPGLKDKLLDLPDKPERAQEYVKPLIVEHYRKEREEHMARQLFGTKPRDVVRLQHYNLDRVRILKKLLRSPILHWHGASGYREWYYYDFEQLGDPFLPRKSFDDPKQLKFDYLLARRYWRCGWKYFIGDRDRVFKHWKIVPKENDPLAGSADMTTMILQNREKKFGEATRKLVDFKIKDLRLAKRIAEREYGLDCYDKHNESITSEPVAVEETRQLNSKRVDNDDSNKRRLPLGVGEIDLWAMA